MQLHLDNIGLQVGAETHLSAINLSLTPNSINVLLGATRAGKTSLLRVMAGLDRPSTGRLLIDGVNVTGVSVRQRNLAMVYQQFINYPSLTVYENIASPLRIQRRSAVEIKKRVTDIAETLRLTSFLERRPSELSGGQQQRIAIARALAKDAELLLLDEPLVNLDYKLREELRSELLQLFRDGKTTVVYTTTEPLEALQLGASTAILHAGRILQFGPTLEVFKRPNSLNTAQAFSDPPFNVLAAEFFDDNRGIRFVNGMTIQAPMTTTHTSTSIQVGFRAHQLRVARQHESDLELACRVDLAEISGSDTYLHVTHHKDSLVAQLPGVHNFAIGARCSLYVDPHNLYGFTTRGELLFAPVH